MTNTERFLLGFVVIVAIILIYINWNKISSLWSSSSSSTIDGTPCSTTGSAINDGTISNGICVATAPVEGSTCTAPNGQPGTIKNGVCTATINTIQVKNSSGATLYSNLNNSFTAITPVAKISNGLILYFTQAIQVGNITYYLTSKGWVSSADVQLVSIAKQKQ